MPLLLTVGIGFSIVLGAVHYWNEWLFFPNKEVRSQFASFVAGASASYLFLNLMPHVYAGVARLDRWVFLFILFGFVLVHVLEKYFYQHARGEEFRFKNRELHFGIFFLYYLILGAIFLDLLESGIIRGVLFAVPVLFYAAVSRMSFGEIHGHIRAQHIFRILIALATVGGVLLAWFVTIPDIVRLVLLSFIIGSLLHIIVVDFVPKEAEGRPAYFAVGALMYALVIIAAWLLMPIV